jgi:hypothetical protein
MVVVRFTSAYAFRPLRCEENVVGFTTTVQSVPITTKVVSSNPAHGEAYSIQLYVIQFVNDL